MLKQYQHWKLKLDENKILWATIDRADSSANSLNEPVLTEFNEILDDIDRDPLQQVGLIIQSAKKTGFIVGADIEQFTKLKDVDEAVTVIKKGQYVFNKLEGLKIPTLALIDGFCLGGGCELALACKYRIACSDGNTKIGLPEVFLGIHPGWGGTVRLPKLIGAPNALNAILTGYMYDARKAYKIGMIDAAVPKRHLLTAAERFILDKPAAHQASRMQKFSNSTLMRWVIYHLQTSKRLQKLKSWPLIGGVLRNSLIAKANPNHYPAPFAVMKNWYDYGVSEEAMEQEAESIGRLLVSETSKNLVRVFFLQEKLKGFGKGSLFKPRHVHVVGAGTMGGDIAAVCALRGMQVTLQDREPKFIGPAIQRAYQLFKHKLKQPHLITAAMDRLMPDPEGRCVKSADVIIEAIFENLEAKQALFKVLEEKAKPDAILATNTSSIALDDINQVMKDPSRLVGIHFFNPVPKMQLVEIIKGEKTNEEVMKNSFAFVGKIGKLPLPVKSSPGFLVNRVLVPYLLEAINLYNEGVPMAVIDKAAKQFGMPMGPVELVDNVGLDVALDVAKYLVTIFGGVVPEILQEKVGNGELGKKSGKGFYEYKKGRVIKPKIPRDYRAPDDITERLINAMIKESNACLEESVVENGDLLDTGMIFGTGFAPFRGGPIHYSKQLTKQSDITVSPIVPKKKTEDEIKELVD